MLDRTEKATDDLEKELHGVMQAKKPASVPRVNREDELEKSWQRELLTLFVKNQIRASLALPLLALVFFLTSLLWTSWTIALGWFAIRLAETGCSHSGRSCPG